MIERFLSIADVNRVGKALQKLSCHDTSRWALTGRLAIEFHCFRRSSPTPHRTLNDIDFVVSDFGDIPRSLANDYLFRHIHPLDPPNKTLLQFVDVDRALRIDVFRSVETVMARSDRVDLGFGPIAIVSLEDLAARSARLTFAIAEGKSVPPKHVTDYLRLVELSCAAQLEIAWRDHRRPIDPPRFAEARDLLQKLIPTRQHLQIPTVFSTDTTSICPRCQPTPPFRLANTATVLSILGYC